MAETFDYVIVGAGSAGCVVAHRLARQDNLKICVLEAGPKDTNPFIHIPAGFVKTVLDPKLNWLYQTESGDWTPGRRVSQPRGKVLGGSGSINGHIFNRGQRSDFDGWAERGNPGWSYAEVLPYFKRLETYHGDGDERYRGKDGPFQVTEIGWRHPLTEAFIQSANELGIPSNPDYNGADQSGVAYAQRSIYRGKRCSPARAYLYPAIKSGRVSVRTGTLVDKILFEDKRARGVQYERDGVTRTVSATREVIVCGGVFNTPQLLQLSGIGSADLLRDFDIPVIADLPGVGENLRDHCYVPVSARVKGVNSLNERSRGIPLLTEIGKYLLTRRGLLSMQPSIVYLSWKSDPALSANDIQISYAPASYDATNDMQLNTYPGVTCAPWQHCPQSKGFVRIQSTNPREHPKIQPNYLSEESDRKTLLASVRLSRKILRANAFAAYFDYEDMPGDQVQSDDEWLDFARQTASTTYHPMGSCRMGPDSDPTAVVDHELRVRGVEGLRVVDASIMPAMVSGNTNAATLMLAEKASDMILGKPPLPAAEV